ncbi:MAG: phosphoribosylglycinamide formyltransferase [Gemmatimonadetes bacterium]|nr:phosphoribosylglycinamide formyltransferase [Gemmatimonadota bacterium]
MSHAPARIVVLVSGGGTNLQALLDGLGPAEMAPPLPPACVVLVISNRADAGALERARQVHVPTYVLRDPADAAELLRALEDGRADLVVLAGYLKRVPPAVVARFRYRMINIHPALLPAFGGPGMYGRRVHDAVLASGATTTGVTVHYVNEEYDRGPIIVQRAVPILANDTADTLAARVLAVEHQLLPMVVLELVKRGIPDEPVRLL